ncbi:hypothetical protein [Algoriphagus halophilus]|uniref:hypothetical protein n=1 Tax=Algoriphagus halophilus TaxID=226505 RepID=UPI00135640AC|nr:hypothetical protein [Algoriphagus halophilus]
MMEKIHTDIFNSDVPVIFIEIIFKIEYWGTGGILFSKVFSEVTIGKIPILKWPYR